ncbi:MAG: Fe-S protein assembly co-chaperone HscB, partial [Phycisphaerales bacterium]
AAVRAITRKIHPDHFANQPPEVRKLATRLSAEVNQALSVLKDPVQRAAYMLELAGGPSAAEVRDVPSDLLAEVMALREQIDEAQSSQDAEPVEQMRSSIQARRTQALEQIASRADQLSAHNDEEKKEFRRLLNSLKYFDNLLDQVAADPLARTSGADHG